MRVRRVVSGFIVAAASLLCMLVSGEVYAQSSVTLYGLISVGVQYVSNQADKSQVLLASGPQQLPRFGIKGRENLGGGYAAIFTLENGFSIANGSLSNGGRMFGRQAILGITNGRIGTLTMGRQYEEMASQLYWSESGVIFAAFGTHIGDNDNVFNSQRFNNSVRYVSPNFRGLSFAAQYAFSNSVGGFSDNSGYSAGAGYDNGRMKLGVAYTQFNHPASPSNPQNGAVDSSGWGFSNPFAKSPGNAMTSRQTIFGIAGSYDLNVVQVAFNYTNVLYDYADSSGVRLQNGEATVTKYLTPSLLLGVGYIYTAADYSQSRAPHWHQVNIGADYFLTKRTDVYVVGLYQNASVGAHAQIYTTSPSSTRNQSVVVVGMRTKF
jgi:predicted porin